jgi:hypothetical protein
MQRSAETRAARLNPWAEAPGIHDDPVAFVTCGDPVFIDHWRMSSS